MSTITCWFSKKRKPETIDAQSIAANEILGDFQQQHQRDAEYSQRLQDVQSFLQGAYQQLADRQAACLLEIDMLCAGAADEKAEMDRRLALAQTAILEQSELRFGTTITMIARGKCGYPDPRNGQFFS